MLQLTELIGFGVGDSGLPVFNITINSTVTDYHIRNAALSAGWDGSTPARINVTINGGAVVRAAFPTNPAMTTDGSWPAGSEIHIVNNGQIRGAGGHGAGSVNHPGGVTSRNGQAGGDALQVLGVSTFVTNNGTIAAGGGGGGAGQERQTSGGDPLQVPYGRGGGGAGDQGGDGSNTSGAGDGTTTTGGNGGTGSTVAGVTSGNGGKGGDRGQAGTGGSTGVGGVSIAAPGSGGAAGRYIVGNNNVTWLVNGTRLGGVAA